MRERRVLIVSNHPLFAEAITRLLQEKEISVIAEVNNLAEAQSVLNTQEVETIIVDQDDVSLQDTTIMSYLIDSQKKAPGHLFVVE